MESKNKRTTVFFIIIAIVLNNLAMAENSYIGRWDSSIYNLLDHPKTVALRVEILDSETRLPLENVQVLFKGTYMTEERTSRHPDGEQKAQEQEFELATRTGKDGIAIAALGWQKEYPWRYGTDEIEKVQSIEVVRRGYHFVEQNTPFKSFLDIGQNKGSDSQEPRFFKMFEETWANECSKSNVKFCTPRFSKNFSDLDNKNSIHPEFFKKIRNKEWGIVYKGPINRTQWEDKNQRLCGPYLIYTIRIYMDRIIKDNYQNQRVQEHSKKATLSKLKSQSTTISDNYKRPKPRAHMNNSRAIARSHWQIGFLEGLDWGMEGEDVGNILSKKGLRLTVVSNHTYEGVVFHDAEVLGQPLYGKIRVDGIRMSFENKKLTSVSFGPADKSESAAEKLYAHITNLFGQGLTTTSAPSREVKESIESPDLCHNSEWYFPSTVIKSRIDYTWMSKKKRYGRWCCVEIYDGKTAAKSSIDYAYKAERFQKLLEKKKERKEVSCTNCNGSGHCLNCNGKGHTYEDNYIRCTYPACGGRGRYKVMNGGIRTCNRCGGTGRLKASGGPKKINCPKCAGSGKCPVCYGKGKVNSR
ncbi:MAG: hypothetical protein DRP65_04320 [Planctomycetota bacterium]|nr:MAG: hypothetical protein DRP65_04320 [Planctomycetota bacterium]